MLNRQQPLPQIDQHRLLVLARESNAVVSRVVHDHDYWSYPPATFACCYAIIRIGEGAHRLNARSRRRLRSVALGIWEDARNVLAHDLSIVDYVAVYNMITEELPLLLSDLERLGEER